MLDYLAPLECSITQEEQGDSLDPTHRMKNKITEALDHSTDDMLRKLNIKRTHGTAVQIDLQNLQISKGKTLEVLSQFEYLAQCVVEKTNLGIIVKQEGFSTILFFKDVPNASSSLIRALYVILCIRNKLSDVPIYVDDERTVALTLQFVTSIGHVYERPIHIQKKNLVDYYGDLISTLTHREVSLSPNAEFAIFSSEQCSYFDVKDILFQLGIRYTHCKFKELILYKCSFGKINFLPVQLSMKCTRKRNHVECRGCVT